MSHDLNSLPFTHAVWFMPNCETTWYICAVTMDEDDALAIVRNLDPMSGAMVALPITDSPGKLHGPKYL
jgi:hypothetical protein